MHEALIRLVRAADGSELRDALAKYEASGDHDHGRGPIAPGGACNGFHGDQCWVARARAALAALEAIDFPRGR